MKIQRIREKRVWQLSAGSNVLYQGRRSPWDHPEIIRDAVAQVAQEEEADANKRKQHPPGRNERHD